MEDLRYEAEKLGVDPAWLAVRSAPIGLGRCPTCWPASDIIAEGNYIEPCHEHNGSITLLTSPDDKRVTAPSVDLVASAASYV